MKLVNKQGAIGIWYA